MLSLLQEAVSEVVTAPSASTNVDKLLQNITESTIYMMGMSFILGSLFTILLLLLLDFMRRNADKQDG